MILVTGCCRSGTKYMSRVLRQAGLDIGHEWAGRDGAVAAEWAIKTDRYSTWYAGERPDFDVIVHQVREPLATIGSVLTISEESWRFIARHTLVTLEMPILERAARYWVQWNQLVEKKAQFTYRIENLEAVWPKFQELLSVGSYEAAISGIPTNTNTRSHKDITWADLRDIDKDLEARVRSWAIRYGYGVNQ